MSRQVFRGLGALLKSRSQSLSTCALAASLLGAFVGLSMRLGQSDAGDVKDFMGLVLFLVALASPLLAAFPWTMGEVQQGHKMRRQEFMTLPVGALSLPTAIFLLGVVFFVIIALMFSLSLGVSVGIGTFREALTELKSNYKLSWWITGAVCAYLYLSSIFALGINRASLSALWIFIPAVYITGHKLLGYNMREFMILTTIWGSSLGIYYLALPFMLYMRSRAHWMQAKTVGREGLESLGLILTVALFSSFMFFGFSMLMIYVTMIAAPIGYFLKKKSPPVTARAWTHLWIAYVFGLVCVVPAIAMTEIVDLRALQNATPEEDMVIRDYCVAPNGKSILVQGTARDHESSKQFFNHDSGNRIQRVAWIDLTGKKQPLVFPFRFSDIASSLNGLHWSADSRYVAVGDASYGRVRGRLGWFMRFEGSVPLLLTLKASGINGQTKILDTQTGDIQTLYKVLISQGWSKPSELLRWSIDYQGRLILQDAQGHSRTFTPPFDELRCRGYHQGQAYLEYNRQIFKWNKGELEPYSFDKNAPALSFEQELSVDLHPRKGKKKQWTATAKYRDRKHNFNVTHFNTLCVGAKCFYFNDQGLMELSMDSEQHRCLIPAKDLKLGKQEIFFKPGISRPLNFGILTIKERPYNWILYDLTKNSWTRVELKSKETLRASLPTGLLIQGRNSRWYYQQNGQSQELFNVRPELKAARKKQES